MTTFYILDTEVAETGVDLSQSVDFTVYGGGGATITKIGIAVRYIDDDRRFVAYETDAFLSMFDPDSSVSGVGTATVTCSLFEFDGWRQRLREIYVFGVQSDGACFSQDVLNLPEVVPVEFVAASAGGQDSGTDLFLSTPVGMEAGDFMVVCLQSTSGAGGALLPGGYTQIANYSRSHFGGGTRHLSAYKFATQADADAVSHEFNDASAGTGAFCGVLAAYRNVNPLTPLESLILVGTDSDDPEVVCPGPSCHTSAVSGSGVATVKLWGPGFLVPFEVLEPGSLVVYTMGGGSGGSGAGGATRVVGPTTSTPVVTNPWILAGAIGQSSVIRVRGVGQGYWEPLVPGIPPRWDDATINYNQGLGSTFVLRPGVG